MGSYLPQADVVERSFLDSERRKIGNTHTIQKLRLDRCEGLKSRRIHYRLCVLQATRYRKPLRAMRKAENNNCTLVIASASIEVDERL